MAANTTATWMATGITSSKLKIQLQHLQIISEPSDWLTMSQSLVIVSE
jgi:hypothetical protein